MKFTILDIFIWVYIWVAPALSSLFTYKIIQSLPFNENYLLAFFAPLIYLLWLYIFLIISSIETIIIRGVFPKKERFELTGSNQSLFYLFSIIYTTKRMLMLFSLPLFDFLRDAPYSMTFLKRLAMRAYSSSTHIGKNSEIHTWPLDPDLTFIDNNVVIGIYSKIIAHGHKRNSKGGLIALTSAIKIHSFVKIGNSCTINMGVEIGEGSIIESNTNIMPHTKIPKGEIWGGNPARFIKKVSEEEDWQQK
ncbi:MAG: acyltransferase [Cellvibrionaceae bacterium]